ncbi:MAG: hypothetical protein AB7F99_04885, partial [Vicinamibacterales bacterium]
KAYLTGSFPLQIETPDAIATEVLIALVYGLPVDQLESFRQRVNAVTVDDIQRVARVYFRPDRLSIVLVGNASVFASDLRTAGVGDYELVDMSELDLSIPGLRRGVAGGAGGAGRAGGAADWAARPGGAGPGAAHQPRVVRAAFAQTPAAGGSDDARKLLDAVIDAKGGLQRLQGVGGIRAVTTAQVITPDGPVDAQTTTYLQYPDHVRVETRLPDATIVQVYDGQRAWVRDPNGTHDVPADAIRELQASLRRDTMSVLLAAQAGGVKVRQLSDTRGEEGDVEHRLELSGENLDPMVLHIDPETHLIARQTYVVGGVGQPLIEESFSDYREIDGVQVAFGATLRRGGELMLERHVLDIAIDPDFDPALFSRSAF